MFDFESADKLFLEGNSSTEQLNNLIKLIIDEKQFRFSRSELKFATDELEKNSIVLYEDDTLKLNDNKLFFYKLYLELTKKFSFVLTEDLTALLTFLKEVHEYFASSTTRMGISHFLKEFNTIAIYYQHHLFKADVIKYTDDWLKEPHNPLYIFSEAFNNFLPYNHFALADLLTLIRKLYALLGYNEPNVINSSIINLKKGLRSFVFQNPHKGKEFLSLLFQNYDAINEQISVDVFSSLLEAEKEFIVDIEKAAKNEIYQSAIVVALSNQNLTSTSELEKILNIIKSITNTSQKYRVQLPQLFASIINNPVTKKEEVIADCFKELNNLVADQDESIVAAVLGAITLIENYEQQKTSLLKNLVEKDNFNHQTIPSLSWIFVTYNEPKLYFEFLIAYTDKFKFAVNEEIFEHAIPNLREKNREEFDRELIGCLIHNQGEIRWMAIRLLSKLCFLHNMRQFSVDILLLKPIEQFKLFTSVFAIFTGPKTSLSLLLPLIDAKDEFVKEAFICRIEILAGDYGGDVTDVMNEQWGIKSEEQQAVYNRMIAYLTEASKRRKAKNNIKELNPLYNQASYMDAYMKTYGKLTSRSINEGVEKGSAFKYLATTVILAKGGGWKNKQTGKISQLGSIGLSMTLPRGYFVSPDNFEWDLHEERKENWENFLIDGKQYFDR